MDSERIITAIRTAGSEIATAIIIAAIVHGCVVGG